MAFVKISAGDGAEAGVRAAGFVSAASLAVPTVAAVDQRLRASFGQRGYGGAERGRGRGEREGHRKIFACAIRVPAVAFPCFVPSQLEQFACDHARDGGDDRLGQLVGGGIRILQPLLAQRGDLAVDAVQGLDRSVGRRIGCGVGFVAHTHQFTAGESRVIRRGTSCAVDMSPTCKENGASMGLRRVRGKV